MLLSLEIDLTNYSQLNLPRPTDHALVLQPVFRNNSCLDNDDYYYDYDDGDDDDDYYDDYDDDETGSRP